MSEVYKRTFYEEILHVFNDVDKAVKAMQTDFGYTFGNMTTVEDRYNFSRNIIDEVDELKEAIDLGDIKEIRDAVADILVFSLGLLHHSAENLYFGKKLQSWIETDYKKEVDLELLDGVIKRIEFDSMLIVESARRNDPSTMSLTVSNICYYCYLISDIYGFDIDEDMYAVIESNMSKFCKDEEDLKLTMQKYIDLEVDVYSKGEFPKALVFSSSDQLDKNGKQYRANKFLKSVYFKEPSL